MSDDETMPMSRPLAESAAAVALGLKVATLRAWRHQGRGPAYVRLGRAIRYLPADLDAFLRANRHSPSVAPAARSSTKVA
jgi:hypothetical protein